jgi:predicted dehydrogenase
VTLRYGIVGGGFITEFQLRALAQVRGVEVAGLVSRTRPEGAAALAHELELGEGTIYECIADMVPHVDVLAFFGPNFTRVAALEEAATAVRARGVRLAGLVCEKPLARNLAEADRVLELAREIGAPTAYFENQIHMKSVRRALDQLRPVIDAMGPLALARAAEEHAGPHSAWFWDPTLQGGGVLSDMGCHSIALAWHALTPPGRHPLFLEPESVQADVGLLKWGRPRYREALEARHGIDYAKTPAEDFATGVITFRNPETDQRVKGQFTVSWMYDKQGLRLLLDGLGPGYALESNSLRSPLEIFIGDEAAAGLADAELALEKSTASQGLLAVQPNEPDPRLPSGALRAPRLGLRTRDRSPYDGGLSLGRGGAHDRPPRCRDEPATPVLRPGDPAWGRGGAALPPADTPGRWVSSAPSVSGHIRELARRASGARSRGQSGRSARGDPPEGPAPGGGEPSLRRFRAVGGEFERSTTAPAAGKMQGQGDWHALKPPASLMPRSPPSTPRESLTCTTSSSAAERLPMEPERKRSTETSPSRTVESQP